MASELSDEERLLAQLCREPRETAWLEFKENFSEPEQIGEYVSALSNGAVLEGRAQAYLVWGVSDQGHNVVGTAVDPASLKVGAEDFIPWLLRLLTPQVDLRFIKVPVSVDTTVWMLEIAAVRTRPLAFKGIEYIRVGSYKKKLKDFPEHERRLWRTFDREVFEVGVALDRSDEATIFELIDYPTYFELLGVNLPESRRRILDYFEHDGVIKRSSVGWAITNLGAALFARDLRRFPRLTRKTVRVIQYQGNSRVKTIRERELVRGYASGFAPLIEHITAVLPRNEIIGKALRAEESLYPELAIRELVANMLIHQDFTETGTGPVIEIFENRMEITNPGQPVIDARRFVDLPPKSRNEGIASMARRVGIAEERGSGWDKVAFQVEAFQLPAPRVEVTSSHTKAVLLAPRSLTRMDREDRVRAVYLHACLREVTGEQTTNASVRERFGITQTNAPQASKLLSEAVAAGVIAVHDPDSGFRNRRYVPYWAVPEPVA